ncbi:thioredoxin family protein [Aliiglaciecola sp. CAU 1673]|uniref:thioredoxin family protein n=1 Tax=Aliiglaciecola sp. CAU 1673 TaxID=3032595 RepID=UPI0023DA6D4D|nr:thioredoxin family protein [Aliiglaciecola sp. CAU 1673]MDF2178870.1 thioredoxin family protein [Aliiglaciecola sp. CAU 1673]
MNIPQSGFQAAYSEEEPTLEQISQLQGEAILELGAPWCGHCMAASAAVEEAFKGYPNLGHIKIYDGKGKPLGRAFKVKLWPTLIRLRDGVEVGRLVRPTETAEVRKLLA